MSPLASKSVWGLLRGAPGTATALILFSHKLCLLPQPEVWGLLSPALEHLAGDPGIGLRLLASLVGDFCS